MSTRRRHVDYRWRLREVMADHGLWATPELAPLLAQRGVELSYSQTHRLVTGHPERLSLHTLAALCDIFDCTPAELIETTATTGPAKTPKAKKKPSGRRPRRARITKKQA
ncbi:MAG: helix-turn-helix transcriptional regulator [Actinobacteria bacterium]|jgi:DNA-binding Xre family transcriptional regulator|nr:helix-turn-helix transcriptional regulator [Actinomycetota bacterium]